MLGRFSELFLSCIEFEPDLIMKSSQVVYRESMHLLNGQTDSSSALLTLLEQLEQLGNKR